MHVIAAGGADERALPNAAEQETSVATVEAQAVPGEMQELTAPESAPAEGAEAATPESGKGP